MFRNSPGQPPHREIIASSVSRIASSGERPVPVVVTVPPAGHPSHPSFSASVHQHGSAPSVGAAHTTIVVPNRPTMVYSQAKTYAGLMFAGPQGVTHLHPSLQQLNGPHQQAPGHSNAHQHPRPY